MSLKDFPEEKCAENAVSGTSLDSVNSIKASAYLALKNLIKTDEIAYSTSTIYYYIIAKVWDIKGEIWMHKAFD